MAKFAVGEIAIIASCQKGASASPWVGFQVEVIAIGPFKYGEMFRGERLPSDGDYITQSSDGQLILLLEHRLRKLPPDDHADDSTEEPGLTRLKKLLEQDTVPHKQTKREKA